MNKDGLKVFYWLAGIIVLTLVIKALLIGGSPIISLEPGPPLSSAVSQGLGTSGANTDLPVAGKDYSLKDVHYFDNKLWVVATVDPIRNDADTAIMVMQKIEGVYQVVMGPATAFSRSYIYTLPGDVSLYLNDKGLLNE
jgi:hypothetical protein